MKIKIFLFVFSILYFSNLFSAEKINIRLGVLAFGTVNWELVALKNEALLETAPFTLSIQKLANPQAGKIALQSGSVDMIVSDWVWVSRLRTQGEDFTFYPYSTTAGALMVPNKSPIKNLQDLQGKKLGIAGGELDKNWLLLQALAQQKSFDINNLITKVYAAPPLLTHQLLNQNVDAIITYWHFAAYLEAQGYRQLLDGKKLLKQLGIQQTVPTLGYVFRQSWAKQHPQVLNSFLTLTAKAKHKLCTLDSAWDKIRPLTNAKDVNTQKTLRSRYCAGQITQWGAEEKQAAEKIYQLLRTLSHNKLTGNSKHLQTGTFWRFPAP
ncbi:MAG: ABC transporter substrate-binding protein [Methylococcales bacterium]|nr:ABC transporter substrate-binding protein [Methylococcales bacterium]